MRRGNPPPEVPVAHPEIHRLSELEALFAGAGRRLYGGEAVSQLEHALQSGLAAERDGASAALVTASFLHDVGHLLAEQGDTDLAAGLNDHHEAVAVRALAGLFDDDVLQPIALHVAAKRYLCTAEPDYRAGLSEASTRSLALQGGPMSAAESARFVRHRHARDALALRRHDDTAKVVGLPTPPLSHYLAIAATVSKASR